MKIRLRIIYLFALTALSSDTIKSIILSEYKWYFKVLELVFIFWYLYVLSKLLIKIKNYYVAVPKDSASIHLQVWGKYYIAIILFTYIGLYVIAINTPEVDFFFILLAIIIGYGDDMYQVVYRLNDRIYYYNETYDMSKEIKSYDRSDNSVEIYLADGESLLINTKVKTKKSQQIISEFFEEG
mgnify:CR=1 FL=1